MKATDKVFPSKINNIVYQGLTARDYIAIQAMTGLLANPERKANIDTVAKIAYKYADTMIKQSEGEDA